MTRLLVRKAFRRALARFFEEDFNLVESGVAERALAHRLAKHLEPEFGGWDIDCEYNRQHTGSERKPRPKTIRIRRVQKKAVPDIIIHRRKHEQNLVAVEMKRAENREDWDVDRDKLLGYRRDHNYRHAVFLVINRAGTTKKYTMSFV